MSKFTLDWKQYAALARQAAAEGCVLLENKNNTLPLAEGETCAVFGRTQFEYYKSGTGSGGLVNTSYVHDLDYALTESSLIIDVEVKTAYKNWLKDHPFDLGNGWAQEPWCQVEMPLCDELVSGAASRCQTALIVIGRTAGEDRDNAAEKGSWYLTDGEEAMLEIVCRHFSRTIVILNVGNIIDMSFVDRYEPSSVLYIWQGGMEGGSGAVDVITGKVPASGRLSDTIAYHIDDYPSIRNFGCEDTIRYEEDIYVGYRYFETLPGAQKKVIYPFGYGLSYTTFGLDTIAMWETENQIFAEVQVTNTGNLAGKEVVQIYFEAPQGLLKKPARQLAAFAKTRLLQPGETQQIRLSFAKADMASYDDLGKIKKSAYILEKGTYKFYIGTSVRDTKESILTMELAENVITKQLTAHLVPTSLKERMLSDGSFEELPQSACNDMNECVFEKMEPGTEEGITPAVRCCARGTLFDNFGRKQFIDVAEGRLSLDDFMAQLSDDDLIHLLGGQPNVGVSNTFGFGNLPDYGVPSIMTADGPAGLRISGECSMNTTAWPCATLLACTWNPALVQQVGQAGAEEVKENNLAVWLTPAVNIHRNPLCGRNFEYYSEDPLIAGKMGAAMVKGIQSQHIAASVKHFAANNKETNRKHSDSRVSERALREIYLKGFEIIVKEAQPWTIMSSYNAINGHRASENRELLEDVLRGEWCFKGMVTTDWWTRAEHYKEIKAGNDVKMGTGFPERVKKAMEMGQLGRPELEHCARRVLELILKID